MCKALILISVIQYGYDYIKISTIKDSIMSIYNCFFNTFMRMRFFSPLIKLKKIIFSLTVMVLILV